MSHHLAIIEQVALYLGQPWKVNYLREPSSWSHQIIDGTGRGLFFRVDGQKFRVSGYFPKNKTESYYDDDKTIGVSCSRNPKDIAADISRRLLPHYFEAWQNAVKRFQDTKAEEERQALIIQALCKVGGGKISTKHQNLKQIFFNNAQADVYLGRDEVNLKLNCLTPDKAIQILWLLFQDVK